MRDESDGEAADDAADDDLDGRDAADDEPLGDEPAPEDDQPDDDGPAPDDEPLGDEPDDEEEPAPRDRSADVRMRWILAVVAALVAGLVVGRVTAPADDADEDAPAPASAQGLPFPAGDRNRSGYWAFAAFEATVVDTFDRQDTARRLGETGTGQEWQAVSGRWGIADNAATNTSGDDDARSLAVVDSETDTSDGLVEVTLSTVERDAGLLFRYRDPDNYWAVTANPGLGTWTVRRVLDGDGDRVGEMIAPAIDGTTVTVIQNGSNLRFLVDGDDYLSIDDGALMDDHLDGGLVAPPDARGLARWNRYLVMSNPPD